MAGPTSGDDFLTGDAVLGDYLDGLGGNDTISGLGGADYLLGGTGNDSLVGGTGGDTLVGEDDNDVLDGGADNDLLYGNNGDDTLLGGAGNDTLDGGTGSDAMRGGTGNDFYWVYDSGDAVIEDSTAAGGADRINSYVTFTLGAYQETLFLYGADAINGTGNGLNNTIYGNLGANVLNGGGGSDTLIGGMGNDTYVVNSGDTVTEYGGGGIDTVRSSVNYTLPNYVEMLVLLGGAVNGTGNALANGLTGNGLANVLTGLGGNDVLEGGAGNDRLDGGLGSDTASYLTATAGVVANLSAVAPQTSGGAGRDTLISIENLAGSRFNDVLTGNAVANVIAGNAGNNLLDGKGGVDTVTYALAPVGVKVSLASTLVQATNWGNDRVLGFENLTGGLFGDTLTGNGLANAIYGGPGNDTMLGLAGNDALDGYTGNDSLAGGLGNDALVGGAGADVFRFDTALNAATNLDAIKDFVAVADTIALENAIFTKLALPGALAEANFSATGVAADADDYVVYNKATGALYYDANGNAAGGTTLFAVLAGSPDDVTAADFVVT